MDTTNRYLDHLDGVNFLLAGVGGQGVLLASNILAEVGLALGYDVKKSEVHGMSQRGGSVSSHVRWGRQVFSPLIGRGEVDVLLSLECLETVRHLETLHPESLIIADPFALHPVTVTAGNATYPELVQVRTWVAQATPNVYWVPGTELAERLGNAKAGNVVLLGALSAFLDVSPETWEGALRRRVPQRFLALNQQAFSVGRDHVVQRLAPAAGLWSV